MIKTIIFDLDGVLIDSCDIHYETLNAALSIYLSQNYIIPYQDHIKKYNGLPTREKLKMLISDYKLPSSTCIDTICQLKQQFTQEKIANIDKDYDLVDIMEYIASKKIAICCASNAVTKTVKIALDRLGIIKYFTMILSNEHVKNCKPHPEILWKCMIETKSLPKTTIVVEDSNIGVETVRNAGAILCHVINRKNLTLGKIQEYV